MSVFALYTAQEAGEKLLSLFDELLGFEVATQVENLPDGESNQAEH